MTNHVATGTATSATPLYTLGSGDTLFVASGALVANTSAGGNAVVANGATTITVLGDIYANGIAVNLAAGSAGTHIAVGNQGSIAGAISISETGTTVINRGQITERNTAITSISSASTVLVENYGSIDGTTGVALVGPGSSVVNYGDIRGGQAGTGFGAGAVELGNNVSGSLSLYNYGNILNANGEAVRMLGGAGLPTFTFNGGMLSGPFGLSSSVEAFVAFGGADTLINSGTIQGLVLMGSGNDIFENRGGRVDGRVLGEGGNDRFTTDSSNATGIEFFDGGAGTDTADLSAFAGAAWVDLTYIGVQVWTSGLGTATGSNADTRLATLASVENIIGTSGSDIVHGNAGDNRYLYTGHAGAVVDQFFGRGGNDTFDASRLGSSNHFAVWVDLAAAVEVWTSSLDFATGSNADTRLADLDSVESVIGTQHSDMVYGNAGNNTYFYNGNFTSTFELSAADFFDGRGGTDTADFSLFTGGAASVWVDLGYTTMEAWSSLSNISTGTTADSQITDLVGVENVVGTANTDTIRGNAQANRLDGFGYGGGGTETLRGEGGNDVFVFGRLYEALTILDFVEGGTEDSIELRSFGTAFDTFAEVLAASTQVLSSTVINFGSGEIITLENVVRADLTAADFAFS